MSGFWGQLEKEDNAIENTVNSDDLTEYEELTQEQDKHVLKANDELSLNDLNTNRDHLKHSDRGLVAIHEPWLKLEKKDKLVERKIHDSPDLQMLQLNDHIRPGH